MNPHKILISANTLSSVFRPTYFPTVGFIILLTLSYLAMLPWSIKVWLLSMVYVFTVATPVLLCWGYRLVAKRFFYDYAQRHKRTAPYCIHLLCYTACMYYLQLWHMPRCLVAIIFVSLLVQAIGVVVNLWWKVSMHSAGAGAVIGGLAAYAELFGFNPVWWLCAAILLAGLVMTSQRILRRHTLAQVIGGCLIGIICGYIGVIL